MVKSKIFLIAYLLLGVLSLSNCQTSKLAGCYVGNATYGTKHDLNLLIDGSFHYIIKEGLASDTILGDWNVKGNKQIILSPQKLLNYHREVNCDTCAGKFYIRAFSLLDGSELTQPNVKVYSKGIIVTNGIVNTIGDDVMQNADSIQINYFGFEPYLFRPQKRNNTIVHVFLIEEQQYLLQNDIVLRVKKNKLITESGIILRK
jgi:hypothetical protein